MIEIPEARVGAQQLNKTVFGKRISKVTAAQTPHKFAWFQGDPQNYHHLLTGQIINQATGHGGMIEIIAGTATLLFGDGVGLRYHVPNEIRPQKHQLLIEFEDGAAISASVQMYGGLWCFTGNELDNIYYKAAKEKPSPLSDQFTAAYFEELIGAPEASKLSAKASLATEQRVPGLGNGVLQDILWRARIHPKRKILSLSNPEKETLFLAVKSVLEDMAKFGGRDTEKDLFGNNGGYKTVMSKNNAGLPCPVCSGFIKKENYMGGSIYFCEGCQRL